jgi:hypothetical protein
MQGGPEDSRALTGYLCVAVGALDGLLALGMALTGKPADERVRRRLILMFGLSAVAVAGVGAAFLLGVFAKEG